MNKYELLLIIKNAISDEEKQAVCDKVESIINANGAVESTDKWGTRKYAYPIDYTTEGYYVLWTFSAQATVPAELENFVKISENCVRCMIIRK